MACLKGPAARPTISVETVVQSDPAAGAATGEAPWLLAHQQHRVASGTSIRALLDRAGMAQTILRIEAGAVGLACHGKRAWLDDILQDGSRVEVVEPIHADAKAARSERVSADRRRRQVRPGTAG